MPRFYKNLGQDPSDHSHLSVMWGVIGKERGGDKIGLLHSPKERHFPSSHMSRAQRAYPLCRVLFLQKYSVLSLVPNV